MGCHLYIGHKSYNSGWSLISVLPAGSLPFRRMLSSADGIPHHYRPLCILVQMILLQKSSPPCSYMEIRNIPSNFGCFFSHSILWYDICTSFPVCIRCRIFLRLKRACHGSLSSATVLQCDTILPLFSHKDVRCIPDRLSNHFRRQLISCT